jgi:hypothetical protein
MANGRAPIAALPLSSHTNKSSSTAFFVSFALGGCEASDMPLCSSATRKRVSLAAENTEQQPSKVSRDDAAAAYALSDGVLHSVFSYAGKGQWLFIILVCKKWQAAYEAMLRELQLDAAFDPAAAAAVQGAERVEKVTLFSAALESLSCIQFAVANGLQVDGLNSKGVYAFARSCGRHGSREVILWARQAGMPWNA